MGLLYEGRRQDMGVNPANATTVQVTMAYDTLPLPDAELCGPAVCARKT